jgi:hypothetical protein
MKTRKVARDLGTTPTTLYNALARGKLAPPPKDEDGQFVWRRADVVRARKALAVDLRRKVTA